MKTSRRISAVAAAAVAVFLGATVIAPAQAYPPGRGPVIVGSQMHALVGEEVTFTVRHLRPKVVVLIKLVGTRKGKTVTADRDGVAIVKLKPGAPGNYNVMAKSKVEAPVFTKLFVPEFSFAVGPSAPAGSTNTFSAQHLRPYVFVTFRIAGKNYTTRSNNKGRAKVEFTMPSKPRLYNPPVFINSKWIGSGHETESLRIRSR